MKLDESVQVLNKSRALYDVADISGSQTVVPGLLQVVLKVISILAFIYFLERYIYFRFSDAFKFCVFMV